MLTGTPLDMTPFGPVLGALGAAYWLLGLGLAVLSLWWPKRWPVKVVMVALVVAIFTVPTLRQARTQTRQSDAEQLRRAEAMARFAERCKTAGERIYRTVDEVDGVMLLKVRSPSTPALEKDAMWPGAAFGSERSGNEYIATFLLYEWRGQGYESQRGNVNSGPTSRPGYRFADVVDPDDGKRYRYTINFEPLKSQTEIGLRRHELVRSETRSPPPRYAVTFDDIVDPEDRKHWIAGSTIRVLDQQTQDIVAEQTRFLMDTGLGATGGFRSPWGWAATYGPRCPRTEGDLGSKTRFFVDQVLRPKQGD